MAVNLQELEKLYFDGTKHAVYQNIPAFVQQALGYSVELDETWRGDSARYKNLLAHMDFTRLDVLGDIGANTGFFSLSLAHRFSHLTVYAYEANPNHHRFITAIKNQFSLQNVQVKNLFVDLSHIDALGRHDCLLNYNVLHHAGVDFDQGLVTPETFSEYAAAYLKKMRTKAACMVFQMGFNWGGNKAKPLVPVQDDAGKVLFMAKIFRQSGWEIDKIFTVRQQGVFEYFAMEPEIILRLNDNPSTAEAAVREYYARYDLPAFSEFYRRPLFYLSAESPTESSGVR